MPKYFPDPHAFGEAADKYDLVPVYRQLLGDHLTPVTAFEVLGRDDHAFLLESVIGGEKLGRFSFIATAPAEVYEVSSGEATIWGRGGKPRDFATTDPLKDLARMLPKRRYHHAK